MEGNINKPSLSKEQILAEIARLEHMEQVAPNQDVVDTKTRIKELRADLAKFEEPKA